MGKKAKGQERRDVVRPAPPPRPVSSARRGPANGSALPGATPFAHALACAALALQFQRHVSVILPSELFNVVQWIFLPIVASAGALVFRPGDARRCATAATYAAAKASVPRRVGAATRRRRHVARQPVFEPHCARCRAHVVRGFLSPGATSEFKSPTLQNAAPVAERVWWRGSPLPVSLYSTIECARGTSQMTPSGRSTFCRAWPCAPSSWRMSTPPPRASMLVCRESQPGYATHFAVTSGLLAVRECLLDVCPPSDLSGATPPT
jgi:hypothetical protein